MLGLSEETNQLPRLFQSFLLRFTPMILKMLFPSEDLNDYTF